jgi:hypothetical protein
LSINYLACAHVLGWVIEDNDKLPYDLPTLARLSDLRAGTPPPVDERVLWSFLNTPPGGSFYSPDPGVIPPRWRAMSVADRRRYFRLALMDHLEIADQPRDSLLVLVEPAVAVLFFYGIARLLPLAMRTRLSFSTFETNADRLVTSLAAMTFDNELSGGDVPPERYRRGFVVNTWLDKATELRSPNAKYADFVLDSLVGARPSDAATLARSIDEKLGCFREAGVTRTGDLEDMVQVNAVSVQVLGLTPQLDHKAWQKSPTQLAYVRAAVRQRLAGPLDRPFLDRVLQSAEYLQLLLDIAVQGDGDENCGPAIAYLVERVPLARLDKLLGPGDLTRRYKLHALRYYVAAQRKLPKDCDWLWTERSPVAQGSAMPPLALDLFQSSCVTAPVIMSSLADVPAAGLYVLFRSILRAPIDPTEKRSILGLVAGRDAFDAVALMPDLKPDMAAQGPMLRAVLLTPLRQALNRVHEQPKRFTDTVAGLEAALPLLAGNPAEERVKGWGELKRTLETFQRERQSAAVAGVKARIKGTKIWEFTDKVCRCADRCFAESDTDGAELRKIQVDRIESCLRTLASMYQVEDLLPDQFKPYLWASLTHQAHTVASLKNKGAGPDWRDHPLRIPAMAVGGVVLLMLLWIVAGPVLSWFGGGHGPEVTGQHPVTSDDGTGQTQNPNELSPSRSPAGSNDTSPPVGEMPKLTPDPGKSPKPGPDPTKPAPGPTPPESSNPPGGANGSPASPAKQMPPPAPKPATPQPWPKQAPTPEDKGTAKPAPPVAEQPGPKPEPKVETPSAVPESTIQVLTARKPINSAFDRPGETATDIFPNLASGERPFRLHGTKLAREIPLSVERKADPSASIDPGKSDRIETQGIRNSLKVTARFKTRTTYPLASFDVKTDGTLACFVDKYEPVPGGFDPRIALQLDALRHCVVELYPLQDPPRLVALIKPVGASFALDSNGGVHIQDVTNGLKPNVLPWGRLFLGQGKILHPEGEFEFGNSWMQEAPCEKWPVPRLAQALGLPEDATIELKSVGEQVRLSLNVPKPGIDRVPIDEKKLSPVSNRKQKIDNLVRAAKADLRRPEDKMKAVQNLIDEIKFPEKGPAFPRPPEPAQLTANFNKRGEQIPNTPDQMSAVADENQRRMNEYRRQYTAAYAQWVTWVRDVLLVAASKESESLDQQIKQIEAEFFQPADQGDGNTKFKEWLRTGVQVQAYIFRLVPYEGRGEPRQIRVLVVEPGGTVADPDLRLGPTAQ